MTTGVRSDPVRSYNFEISLLDASGTFGLLTTLGIAAGVLDHPAGGFSECSGLNMSLDVEDYEEGGRNGTVLKFPTRVKWSPITLKRGLGRSDELWRWFYAFVEGRGRRRDGLITLRNERHEPHAVWSFRRGLPTRWDGPSMNAMQTDVAIETIEITHEGLLRLPV